MGTALTRTGPPARRRRARPNTILFPRGLRDAIPDLPTCIGRSLQLDAMDGMASNSQLLGARVQLNLIVRETGKLTGEFVVRVDLQPDAARALADTLVQLADRAERSTPVDLPIM